MVTGMRFRQFRVSIILIILALYPLTSQAQTTIQPSRPSPAASLTWGEYTYRTNVLGQATITSFNSSYVGVLYIPNTLGGCSVTSFSSSTFNSRSALTSVTIPASVTNISETAFSYCNMMTNITVDAENPVYASADGILFNKTLTDLIICPIRKTVAAIPPSVTNISASAFSSFNMLTNIMVDTANPIYASDDGILFNKTLTDLIKCPNRKTAAAIPAGVTSINAFAFANCSVLASVSIPESVISIGVSAFSACSALTSVTIPAGVTNISASAFANCSALTSVAIPDSVISIGPSAFSACSALTSVTIPASVSNISESAFAFCNMMTNITVDIGNPVYASSDGILFNKTLTDLIKCPNRKTVASIPTSVTNISESAFENCSVLASVTIPESVISIGPFAFSSCSALTSVTIPSGVTNISTFAFGNCSVLASVTIPDSVTSIGSYAFSFCSALTSVTIPASVTNISESAFAFCSALPSATIPESVISIGASAFSYCSALTSVAIPANVTNISESAFAFCSALASVTIPDSVVSIGTSAFSYCITLSSVTIPASVTNINESAFAFCNQMTNITVDTENPVYGSDDGILFNKTLTELIKCPNGKLVVTIPPTVTNISASAFANCSVLASVTIPDSVISIGASAFSSCSALTSVTIPDHVISIGASAFSYCITLSSVTIPASVTSIGMDPFPFITDAFAFCTMMTNITVDTANPVYASEDGILFNKTLTDIIKCPNAKTTATIPLSVTNINGYAFSYCTALISVTIPGSVISIESSAFNSCSALTSFVIPASVTSIGKSALDYCTALTNITVDTANPVYASEDGILFNKTFTDLIKCPDGLTGTIIIPSNVIFIGVSAFSPNFSRQFILFKGDAPVTEVSNRVRPIAPSFTSAPVYYLSDNIGWPSTFNGHPSILWDPSVQPGSSCGFSSGMFGFNIIGTPQIPVKIEATTSLVSGVWIPITNTMIGASGTISFDDLDSPQYPSRYYRIVFP